MKERKNGEVARSQMFGYALFGCGANCLGGILGSFITLYLTDNLLLSMGFIAGMMSVARIVNAITEALCGFVIDRTHTRIGKARPWILGTAFFTALPVFMVFNCPLSLGQTGRMVWVFVSYMLHVAVFGAVISIAVSTLLIKMTSNTNSRAKIANMSNLLGQISQLVVSAYGIPVLMYFGGYETGYRGMTLIFCTLGFIGMFLTGVICKENPEMIDETAKMLQNTGKRNSVPVRTQIKYVFGSKYAFPLFGMFALYNFAAMISGSLAVYFIRDVLGNALYMTQISYAKLIPGIICGLLGIVPMANAKLGKRKALIVGSGFQTVGFACMLVSSLPLVIVGNALYGIGMSFYGALMGASTADVADYVNLKNHTDVSGFSTSVAQLGMRIGMLLGSVGVSVILSLGNYDAQAANSGLSQAAGTLIAERVGYVVIPLICSVLLIVLSNFMNADEEVARMRMEESEVV